MLLLQGCILPFCALLLVGATFMIGTAGVEPSEVSAWKDQDVAWINETAVTWTNDSICLLRQSQSPKETGVEQVNAIHAETIHGDLTCESHAKLPLYKF